MDTKKLTYTYDVYVNDKQRKMKFVEIPGFLESLAESLPEEKNTFIECDTWQIGYEPELDQWFIADNGDCYYVTSLKRALMIKAYEIKSEIYDLVFDHEEDFQDILMKPIMPEAKNWYDIVEEYNAYMPWSERDYVELFYNFILKQLEGSND
ncbi:MAG: hypothetical protein QXL34_06525 [Thermosphaera sp.]